MLDRRNPVPPPTSQVGPTSWSRWRMPRTVFGWSESLLSSGIFSLLLREHGRLLSTRSQSLGLESAIFTARLITGI